jgi:hypothetical protein
MKMTNSFIIIVATAVLIPASLCASELTHEQFHAITQVANAYAHSSFCDDVAANTAGTEKYLISQFGEGEKFDAKQLAEFGLLIVGTRAMTIQFVFGGREPSKREAVKFCAETLRLFGPSGTEIPGLLD